MTFGDQPTTPAAYWRSVVEAGFRNAPSDGDPGLEAYLQDQLSGAVQLERFVLSVALLTFGHLDAAEDIVRLIPEHPHPARVLARSLNGLTPMTVDPTQDPERAAKWLRDHRSRLSWVEARGCFVLAGG